MEKDKKPSIIKEALSDYNSIMEAANANAKKKLVDEFPEKFDKLLKEELNKNKTKKESYKKLDESEESTNVDEISNNEESVMKEKVEETSKVVSKGEPFNKGVKVSEAVKITDTVGDSQPFDKKAKKGEIVEEREKSFMGDIEGDTPNKGEGEAQNGNRFTDKIGNPDVGKPISNLEEEYDITELDMNSVASALDEIEGNDEIITLDEIEDEISSMENLGGELDNTSTDDETNGEEIPIETGDEEANEESPINKVKEVIEMLQGLVSELGGSSEEEPIEIEEALDASNPEGLKDYMRKGMNAEGVDAAKIDALLNGLGQNPELLYNVYLDYIKAEEGNDSEEQITSFGESTITEEDIQSVIGSTGEIEEAHGMAYSSRRNMAGRSLPGSEYLGKGEADQSPAALQEAKTKINGLIAENKKLTKKLNESKKFKESATNLVENYKNALEKYRTQLKEMAIFNTNLAHVNNLLVNEELALTQEDKLIIIKEFKQAKSISESQEKYKNLLSEMKVSKKTISESLETRVSTSIQPSSKQKLDEVVEKTAYANNEHIKKMQKLMFFGEKKR